MKFRRIYIRALRYNLKEGLITDEQFQKLMQPLRWGIRKRRRSRETVNVMQEVEKYVMDNVPKSGISDIFAWIFEFVKEHWFDILKLILSLVVLLEPNPTEHPIGDLECE